MNRNESNYVRIQMHFILIFVCRLLFINSSVSCCHLQNFNVQTVCPELGHQLTQFWCQMNIYRLNPRKKNRLFIKFSRYLQPFIVWCSQDVLKLVPVSLNFLHTVSVVTKMSRPSRNELST